MLCWAVSSSYQTFLLKSTSWLLQPEWPNMDKLQSRRDCHADPSAQTCISVQSPTQVTLCNDTCAVSSSCSSAAQGDAEQSSPSLRMQEDLLLSSATKTQTPAWESSEKPWTGSITKSELKIQLDTHQALKTSNFCIISLHFQLTAVKVYMTLFVISLAIKFRTDDSFYSHWSFLKAYRNNHMKPKDMYVRHLNRKSKINTMPV